MKKSLLALALVIVTAVTGLAFSSCSSDSEFPVTAGNITIKAEPKNIIILNKNDADIISCIGYIDKLAGRSDSVNQKGMELVPSVGSANDPSYSKIKKLKADVVFADDTLKSDTKKKLQSSGITVISHEKANTVEQLKKLYIQFGTLLGGKTKGKSTGKEAFGDLYDSLNSVKDAVEEKDVKTTVCYLYTENGEMKTFTNSTWESLMLDYTGAANVFKNEKSDTVNLKKLTRANPDYIFCADKETIKPLKSGKTKKKLSALNDKTKRYLIPMDELSMQGDTSLETLKKMLKYMYPEDFK